MKATFTRKILRVKTTGGHTAQLLALMNAIYLSKKIEKEFQIQHFSTSTGTYWPLAIRGLLREEEIFKDTKIDDEAVIAQNPGEYIPNFALRQNGINRIKFLYAIQQLGLDVPLRRIRGEVVISGKRERLDLVSDHTRMVSGIYVPLVDEYVFDDLSNRFNRASLPNPFSRKNLAQRDVVMIHYRLGDMRKIPSRIPGIGGHGVVDPVVFAKLISQNAGEWGSYRIEVISDEPLLAQRLLSEVGVKTVISSQGNVWRDLQRISESRVFLGSMSQFSLVAALLVNVNQGEVLLPKSIYEQEELNSALRIRGLRFEDYSYLPEGHWIFQ